jgi:hypothetical protein
MKDHIKQHVERGQGHMFVDAATRMQGELQTVMDGGFEYTQNGC